MDHVMPAADRVSQPAQQPTHENPIAWTKNLNKNFNGNIGVEGLTFDVPRGSIFGFIGPSGCGKTTTIRLLTGIYIPTSGEVNVLGKSPARFTMRDRERLGYLTQNFVLYPDLTVWENMSFAASLYGVPFRRSSRLKNLLEFVELEEHRNKLTRNLSGGMQRRLALASTLIHKPDLLFLDEPTAGIDPVLRRKIWDYFEELRVQGYTLFVTTQYVGESAYCDLVGVMAQGKLLLVDSPEGLRRRAFGGDVVRMRTEQAFNYNLQRDIQELPYITGQVIQVGARDVQMVVDEANTAIPRLMEWARKHQLDIESIGEDQPPFDDVFVKLVEQEEQQIHA